MATSIRSVLGIYQRATDPPEELISLTDLSVGSEGTASGDGSLSYDSSNGVFTYTPPDLGSFTDITANTVTVVDTLTLQGNMVEEVYSSTAASFTLDSTNGTIQFWTLSGNATVTDSLTNGESVTLHIDDGTGYTITWPTITWIDGSAPTLDTTYENVVHVWKASNTTYGALIGVLGAA